MKPHALVLLIILSGCAIKASAQTCLDIRGDYTFVETGTLTVTILGGGGSDRCTFTERGTTRITQSGCSVTFRPLSSLGCTGCDVSGFDLGCNPETCSGSVNGNSVTLNCSQYWPLPSQIEPYITSVVRSASGIISGNRITITASGRIDTDLPINDGVRFTWTSRWVLDRILDCPNISIQPSNRTVYAGGTVSFAVVAAHSQPLTYQWRRNGANLPGQTSPVLTLRNVATTQKGDYTVLVRNSECTVTSAVAKLDVKSLPVLGPPWHEGWESATPGCRTPSETIDSTVRTVNGLWILGDTVSGSPECGPTGNRGCILVTNGSQALFLHAATNADCAENVFIGIGAQSDTNFAIPLLPGTQISAFEHGFLAAPGASGSFPCAFLPCANTVHLAIQDDRNNQVVYIWQRPGDYIEHALTNGEAFAGYLEVFLDPAGGMFNRNLYEDFARIAGVPGVGNNIRFIGFAVDSAGWAMLDDLKIGRDLIDAIRPNVSIVTPANNARTSNAVLTVSGKAMDNRLVARVLFQTGDGPFQPAIGTTNWTATALLEPGTNLFRVKSVDADNNESLVVTNRYVFVVTSPLTLMVSAGGKVTGATNGQLLEVGRTYALTATPNSGFCFTGWSGDVASTNRALTITMRSNMVLQATFADCERPTTTILAPASNTGTSNSMITVRGSAKDNGRVELVQFKVNSAPFALATGTTNWTATAMLQPGTNLFCVKSTDADNNESLVVTNRYVFVVTSPLTLMVGAGGKVTGATNGQLLEVGRTYALTATPNRGFCFTGWSGDIASTNRALTITMRSNMVLQASFVDCERPVAAILAPANKSTTGNSTLLARGTARDNVQVASVWRRINGLAWEPAQTTNAWADWSAVVNLLPGTNTFSAFAVDSSGVTSLVQNVSFYYDQFLPLAGDYTGLFYDSNAVAYGASGLFKATVRPRGLFSGALQNGLRKFPFTGQFDLDGMVTNRVTWIGSNGVMAELSIDLLGAGQILGRVTDGSWSARLVADHKVFHATNPATAFTNKYTLLIPGSTHGPAEPEGDGLGTVTISKAGLLSFAGTLADGTRVSQSVPLSKLGDWAFYPSFGTVKASMLGWLRVSPAAKNPIAGKVAWLRPAGPNPKTYTNGFAFQSLAEGSVYTRATTDTVLEWDSGNSGIVVFSGGNLGVPFTNLVALGPGNRVTNLGPQEMTFSVTAASGLFKGMVKPPGQTRLYSFNGAVLQQQGYGGGYLLCSNLSSRLYLGPKP